MQEPLEPLLPFPSVHICTRKNSGAAPGGGPPLAPGFSAKSLGAYTPKTGSPKNGPFFAIAVAVASSHRELRANEPVSLFSINARPHISLPFRAGLANVAPHLNFTGGAPPAAPAPLTMHLEFPAAPSALPPSPISLRCVLAHNTLRVPLLDARVTSRRARAAHSLTLARAG